ncbi:hypothetical protein O3P69_013405 [Scylla paramamosain]|uniref:Uncharacterized protein n=1 Tax=Scylla paramamosain TaxID=85552 RepID=A0AAW0U1K2_SCYPA
MTRNMMWSRNITWKKKNRENISSSEDEAFANMGVAIRKKRRKLFQDPQPGPSHQAILSSRDMEGSEEILDEEPGHFNHQGKVPGKRNEIKHGPAQAKNHSSPSVPQISHERSDFSRSLSELLPDDLSVGTILSTRVDGRGEESLLAKPTPSKMYSDILQAMAACNRSKDIRRYIVRWNSCPAERRGGSRVGKGEEIVPAGAGEAPCTGRKCRRLRNVSRPLPSSLTVY